MYYFRRVEKGYYKVMWGSQLLGEIYYDSDAWSYGRWFIAGEPQVKTPSFGGSGKVLKAHGYRTREEAGHKLALMQSGAIMKAVNC
jgi:hypothetical protein